MGLSCVSRGSRSLQTKCDLSFTGREWVVLDMSSRNIVRISWDTLECRLKELSYKSGISVVVLNKNLSTDYTGLHNVSRLKINA